MMRHGTIGTEHLLLGLAAEGGGVAFRALSALGVTLDAARAATENQRQPGRHEAPGHLPFNDSAKWACEQALREAVALSVPYVGTEHILLALVRAQNHTGAFVLADLGVSLLDMRSKVLELLRGYAEAEKPATAGREPAAEPESPTTLASITDRLEAVTADLEGYLERRAAELAGPIADAAARDHAAEIAILEERLANERDRAVRGEDLVAELRKTLDVRGRQLDRARAESRQNGEIAAACLDRERVSGEQA